MKEEEISILDYLKVVFKHWKVISVIVVGGVVLAVIFTVLSPKIYKAKATALPQLSPPPPPHYEPTMSFLHEKITTPQNIFLAILKSRRMADTLIKEFNLINVYNVDSMERARNILQKNTTFRTTKEGVIEVSVDSLDPNLSAALANAYLVNLDMLNTELITTTAKQARIFIEDRLANAKTALSNAEAKLEAFRKKHSIVDISTQAEAAIDAAAKLEAEITAAHVQLKVMQDYTTHNHPEISKLKLKIATLQEQLDKMKYGSNPEKLHLPFKKLPHLSRQFDELLREKKIQETLFGLLAEQYEKAKIDEARDTPTIQILDEAIVPPYPYKPKLFLNVALSVVLSLFIGLFVAFFLEYISKLQTRPKLIQENF